MLLGSTATSVATHSTTQEDSSTAKGQKPVEIEQILLDGRGENGAFHEI